MPGRLHPNATPLPNDDGHSRRIGNVPKVCIPHARHVGREVRIAHVPLTTMAIDVWCQDETVWHRQGDRVGHLTVDVLSPPIASCGASARALGGDEPTRTHEMDSISDALHEVLPHAPAGIVRLVEHVHHDDVGVRAVPRGEDVPRIEEQRLLRQSVIMLRTGRRMHAQHDEDTRLPQSRDDVIKDSQRLPVLVMAAADKVA